MELTEKGGWLRAIWVVLLLLLPLGEGGATPLALLASHTLILLAALAAAASDSGEAAPIRLPAGLVSGIPLFLGVATLASVGSPYPYASFLRLWDLLIALLAFALARRSDWGERGRLILADSVLAAAALQSLLVFDGSRSGRMGQILASLGLQNPNHESAYLNLAVLVIAPVILRGGGRGRWIRGALAAVCLSASILLASRGGLMGLACGTLVLLGLSWREIPARARVPTLLFFLAIVLLAAGMVRTRFSAAEDPFRYERIRIWQADLRCLSGSPVLGVGPGIYRHVAHRYNFPLEGPIRYGRSFQTPHSEFFGLLVETGVAGFAAGMLVLGGATALVFRSARRSGGVSRGLLCALAALAVQGIAEDISQRPALLLTMAILIGAASREERRGEAPYAPRPRSLTWRVAFGVLPILFAWVTAVLNPYLAYRSDRSMRFARSLQEMERHFALTLRVNPYQADTYRFPATAFLSARPPVAITLDLYARFRRDLDEGIRRDRTSADLEITRARLEAKAFRELFHDAATRDRALAAYRGGILKAPHDPRPRVELAAFQWDLGWAEAALQEVDRALGEEPSYVTARLLRIRLLLEQGSRDEAREEWGRLRVLKKTLSTYRPESPYAADIVRENEGEARWLEDHLGVS